MWSTSGCSATILSSILPMVVLSSTLLRSVRALGFRHELPRMTSTGSLRVVQSVTYRIPRLYSQSSWENDDSSTRVDEFGRRVRTGVRATGRVESNPAKGRMDLDGWDDFDHASAGDFNDSQPTSNGWDDFDPFATRNSQGKGVTTSRRRRNDGNKPRSRKRNYYRASGRSGEERSYGGERRSVDRSNGRQQRRDRDFRSSTKEKAKHRQINMNALSGAGFDHLYGLSSVLNALNANRRDFTPPEDDIELLAMPDDGDDQTEQRKPEAQFKPWFFVQEKGSRQGRSASKASAAEELTLLAEQHGIPVAEVDKGVLNTLCGNRPHQGFVLRCGQLQFEPLPRIPAPQGDASGASLWIVLDEVVDPQNLGALLRSVYFLGGSRTNVLVCSKNSAPLSPVVSAASAGALELMTVYSTSNLPRTLTNARDDGFRIVGASSSIPRASGNEDNSESSTLLYDIQQLPPVGDSLDDRPVILVLGSEGHGLRSLVAKTCSEFVTIPSGDTAGETVMAVDSLNVSVTGGILLWHLLYGTVEKTP